MGNWFKFPCSTILFANIFKLDFHNCLSNGFSCAITLVGSLKNFFSYFPSFFYFFVGDSFLVLEDLFVLTGVSFSIFTITILCDVLLGDIGVWSCTMAISRGESNIYTSVLVYRGVGSKLTYIMNFYVAFFFSYHLFFRYPFSYKFIKKFLYSSLPFSPS